MPPPAIRVAAARALRADGSYLVTGGLGGLGLTLAHWLAAHGAGHLVLVGRGGVRTPAVAAAVEAIRGAGARVTVAQADVGDAAALAQVVAPLTDLRGVVHAAGLLDDGLLAEQTEARFERVLRPKVAGARHLDRLTRGMPLDFFVLSGSAASVLGSPGQGNYAAANAYLAALAWRRRSEGLPALCLDWGAFAEVGLAAAQANRGDRVAARGMRLLAPDEGVRLFERLLGTSLTRVAPCPIDVPTWLDFYPELAGWPYVERLVAHAIRRRRRKSSAACAPRRGRRRGGRTPADGARARRDRAGAADRSGAPGRRDAVHIARVGQPDGPRAAQPPASDLRAAPPGHRGLDVPDAADPGRAPGRPAEGSQLRLATTGPVTGGDRAVRGAVGRRSRDGGLGASGVTPDFKALLARALARIDRLEADLAQARADATEPVAVVGLACRFPRRADT